MIAIVAQTTLPVELMSGAVNIIYPPITHNGNGRMSRLLTTLLLYRNGFYVGKYISLEAKIAKNKDLYYAALAQAQIGWHEGTEDVVPFIKYLLGTILAAYKDVEDRMALVETKLPALEMVRRASENRIGRFKKQDIRELCPTLSDSSIEGALRKLVAAGELKKRRKREKYLLFQAELDSVQYERLFRGPHLLMRTGRSFSLLFAIYIGCRYDATAVEILPLLCDPDLEKRCFLRKQATASHT